MYANDETDFNNLYLPVLLSLVVRQLSSPQQTQLLGQQQFRQFVKAAVNFDSMALIGLWAMLLMAIEV